MGAKQSQTLSEMSKGEAYQNFATSIRAYQTLKTYRYRLIKYVSNVRDTYDLDKIIATDLDNRKQAEAYVKRFIDELKTRGVSEYCIKSSFAAIRHLPESGSGLSTSCGCAISKR
jgi:hypothetical protein